jgi:hypothetical protein
MNGMQLNLAARASRCMATALNGDAVILVVSEDEKAEATRLIGSAPVIVANRDECRQFLVFMQKGGGGVRSTRKRH